MVSFLLIHLLLKPNEKLLLLTANRSCPFAFFFIENSDGEQKKKDIIFFPFILTIKLLVSCNSFLEMVCAHLLKLERATVLFTKYFRTGAWALNFYNLLRFLDCTSQPTFLMSFLLTIGMIFPPAGRRSQL